MSAVRDLAAIQRSGSQNGRGPGGAYVVTFTEGPNPKLVLPDLPAHDDPGGLCAWVTCALRFDPQHPATGVVREGDPGPAGQLEIRRAGAASIRIEPLAAAYKAQRLVPILGSQLQPTDGEPYGFKDEHARRIAHALLLLAGPSTGQTAAQETAAIVGTFLSAAVAVEGHATYGTGPQRYEAAVALRRDLDEDTGRPVGPAKYLIDADTGELVIRVSDLQAAARAHKGSSLEHGWLNGRMEHIGWSRCTLDGHALPGRDGRRGPNAHARADAYRGHLPASGDEVVTT